MSTPRILGGRYEVGELIGRGGMAEVHAGHDSRLGRPVAIKILRSDLARDKSFLTRFRREAQSAASLNHPAIVSIYDSGEDTIVEQGGGELPMPYIVMEYVEGQTLRDHLDTNSTFPEGRALAITQGVLSALAYSHEMGIVHRDIKPANVMLTRNGSVKVMDFGIARAIADTAATMTHTHAVVGTAQYLSPEQAQGQQVDARSDLYSTGAMLFELLTGRPPFVGDSPVAIAYQHVGERPHPPSQFVPELSEAVDAVTLHALEKDRERRYQSAEEFRADLQAVREHRPISGAAAATAAAFGIGAAAAAAAGQPNGVEDEGATRHIAPTRPRTDQYPTQAQERSRQSDVGGLGALGLGAAGAGAGAGNAAYPRDGAAYGRDDDRRGEKTSPWVYVLVTLLVLALLGGLGFLAKNLLNKDDAAAAKISVPSVIGFNETAARSTLTDAKLVPNAVTSPSDKPKGEVFAQDPKGGTSVDERTTVTFRVSSGPASVKVPDVTGQAAADARSALEAAGLKVKDNTVISHDDPSQPAGHVLRTEPPAGKVVGTGSEITVHVSSGKVKVPTGLEGQDVLNVTQTLQGLKLKVKPQYQTTDKQYNSVLNVDKAGETVPMGTEIVITVAQPATQTQTVTETPTPTSETPSTPPTTSAPSPPSAPPSSTPPGLPVQP